MPRLRRMPRLGRLPRRSAPRQRMPRSSAPRPQRMPRPLPRLADAPADRGLDRRRFLTWAGGAAVLGAIAAAGGYALQAGSRAVSAIRDSITLPTPTATATVPPSAELDIEGLSPVVTPNAQFYRIDTALAVPAVDPSSWSLRIHGMVDQEVTLTWDELLALPLEESVTTLAVRLERGRRRTHRQRGVARLPDPRAPRAGGADRGRRHGALAQRRRLHGVDAARRARGRPQRHPRDRHERRPATA